MWIRAERQSIRSPRIPPSSSVKTRGMWRRYARTRRSVVGLVIMVFFCLMPVLSPLVAPYAPQSQILEDRLSPPSIKHMMGTDGLGRDVFSRALYASQISIPVGVFAMLCGLVAGTGVGILAGYLGSWIDQILMRIVDTLLAFPTILLIITLTAILGRTLIGLILALGLTSWGINARVIRGQVLSIRGKPFVEAARASGATHLGTIVRHILPNIMPIVVVEASMRIAWIILLEGSLSFLGVGIQPPDPSWGNMIAEGGPLLRRAWWISVFPGVFMFLCVMSFNLVGDGLRDLFDPH